VLLDCDRKELAFTWDGQEDPIPAFNNLDPSEGLWPCISMGAPVDVEVHYMHKLASTFLVSCFLFLFGLFCKVVWRILFAFLDGYSLAQ
jgi:hypothetical protein